MPRSSRLGIAATAAASLMLLSAPRACAQSAAPFTFNDVHFWTGSGTNKAVVLIDFYDVGVVGGLQNSLAWGFRWNGSATQLDALRAIARDDRRFHYSGDLYPVSIAYDFDNDGGAFNLVSGAKTDTDDLVASTVFGLGNRWNCYWVGAALADTTTYSPSGFTYCMAGASEHPVTPNSFFGMKLIPWIAEDFSSIFYDPVTGQPLDVNEISFIPAPPVAAHTPYVFRVRNFDIGTDFSYDNFTDPNTVLGRPATVDLADDRDEDSPVVPITPFVPASAPDKIFRIADIRQLAPPFAFIRRGFIEVEFDHPVVDDPKNPWGIDFIVFGNALYPSGSTDGSPIAGTGNPNFASVGGNIGEEPGLVEVSQDGSAGSWRAILSPMADTFAPTLGFRYDPDNADASLFEGNQWWGGLTDPTYPVAPNAASYISNGTNLAQIAKWYNGSAGGTGFDISGLDLPATHDGKKWFKFVRITNNGPTSSASINCEIDAIADVYPDTAYGLWSKEIYTWPELSSIGKKNAVADASGRANFESFLRGLSPAAAAPEFSVSGFTVENGQLFFSFKTANANLKFSDLMESGILPTAQQTTNLAGQPWFAFDYDPLFADAGASIDETSGARIITVSSPSPIEENSFFKFGFSSDDN
jgi:hypothetical protein